MKIYDKAVFILVLILLVTASCRQPGLDLDEISSEDQVLVAFSFDSDENVSLDGRYAASIEGTTVYISLPSGTDRSSMIPQFELNGKGLQVNGVWQKSGVTAQNFTTPVSYDLIRSDNSIIQYTVVAGFGDLGDTSLWGFSFRSDLNASLSSRVDGYISGSKIILNFPFETTIGSLIPTFETPSGAVVSYDGVTLYSDAAPNINPASGGFLKVDFAEGTSKIYKFEVNTDVQKRVYVSTAGNVGVSGSQNNPLSSIEEAYSVALAKNLNEIRISAGSYTLSGNLEITENMTIRGGYSTTDWSDRYYESPDARVNASYMTVISTGSGSSGTSDKPLGTLIYNGGSVGSSSLLEGVTVKASTSDPIYTCAVSILDGASPVIQFSSLMGNSASSGSAAFISYSAPSLYSSTIIGQAGNDSVGLQVGDNGNPLVVSCYISSDNGSSPISGIGLLLDGSSPGGYYYNNSIFGGASSQGAAVKLNESGGTFINNLFSNSIFSTSNYCFQESSGAQPALLQYNNFSSDGDGIPIYYKDGMTELTSSEEINALGYAGASGNVAFKIKDYSSYESDYYAQCLPPQLAYKGEEQSIAWQKDLFNNDRSVNGSESWSMGALELDYTYLGEKYLIIGETSTEYLDGIWSSLNIREAVNIVNTWEATDTIVYSGGASVTTLYDPLEIETDLYLAGSDDMTTLSGNDLDQIFLVDDGDSGNDADVFIKNIILDRGFTATGSGGAINSKENLYLYNCVFQHNQAMAGGAIYQDGGTLLIANTIFDSNTGSAGSGGALYIQDSPFSGCNLVFTGNEISSAGEDGSSIYLNESDSSIVFSSFVNNLAVDSATIYSENSGTTLVVNSVFQDNTTAPTYKDVEVVSGILDLTGSSIGAGSFTTPDAGPFFQGNPGFSGIISAPRGDDSYWKTSDDNLHAVDSGQPMVNVGNESYLPVDWADADEDENTTEPFPYDITKSPRVQGGAADAGAYESF